MKILAVGWNYLDHNQEMQKVDRPTEPTIFSKPDSALLKDGKPFFIPDFSEKIEYETEIVVRIGKVGRNIAERFAYRYIDAITVGIDFTARDLQQKLRKQGAPWEISKGFDGSAVIGKFIPISAVASLSDIPFHLQINQITIQQGNSKDMIFSIAQIIAYISNFFTLKTGDIIYTGTPVGVGGVHIDDHLEGYLQDNKLLDFYVR